MEVRWEGIKDGRERRSSKEGEGIRGVGSVNSQCISEGTDAPVGKGGGGGGGRGKVK